MPASLRTRVQSATEDWWKKLTAEEQVAWLRHMQAQPAVRSPLRNGRALEPARRTSGGPAAIACRIPAVPDVE